MLAKEPCVGRLWERTTIEKPEKEGAVAKGNVCNGTFLPNKLRADETENEGDSIGAPANAPFSQISALPGLGAARPVDLLVFQGKFDLDAVAPFWIPFQSHLRKYTLRQNTLIIFLDNLEKLCYTDLGGSVQVWVNSLRLRVDLFASTFSLPSARRMAWAGLAHAGDFLCFFRLIFGLASVILFSGNAGGHAIRRAMPRVFAVGEFFERGAGTSFLPVS